MRTADNFEDRGIESMNCCLEPAAASPRDEAAVLFLNETRYGSLNAARLDELRRQIDRAIDAGDRAKVVVDLRDVESAGAAFVGILAEAAGRLRAQNRRLAVRGDRLGLLDAAGLTSLLHGR